MSKSQQINRSHVLTAIERLQDRQHEYLQLQSKLIREKAALVDAYHIRQKDLQLGEIDKAIEDIENEVAELKEMLK